jgi:DNA-binding beta-propeller fold protein YncE
LQHPRGVCVDGQGRVIVVECKIQRLVVFNQHDGTVLQKINCAPRLEFPVGVAANDRLGEIYIADNRGHSVKVCNMHVVFFVL